MKKFSVLLIAVGILIIGYLLSTQIISKEIGIKSPEKSLISDMSSKTNYTASFAIFTNGTFRIFTSAMYHNLSEDVYIESENPNIIHVKKGVATWNDFFKTLPMELTKNCLITGTKQIFCTEGGKKLKFFINDKEDRDMLDKNIKSGDRLLVTYGNADEKQIQKQLQQLRNIK